MHFDLANAPTTNANSTVSAAFMMFDHGYERKQKRATSELGVGRLFSI